MFSYSILERTRPNGGQRTGGIMIFGRDFGNYSQDILVGLYKIT